jgi:hypothetical protein
MNQSLGGHGERGDLVGKGKRQVECSCAVHVDGVQSGVGALHLLRNIFRDTKNVRNVVAMPLVQMTPLLNADPWPFRWECSDRRWCWPRRPWAPQSAVPGNGEVQVMRQRPGPFDGTGDDAARQ